jgi:signal transduction histidine kinase/ActR/RegA family two-component response regulator
VFGSRRPGRKFSQTEQDILLAFAEHASLALSDAKSVAAQNRNFHQSLSDISTRAAMEKKGLEEQLRQAQKMEAVGRLAGGIAHDFNNLLTVIQMSARFLKESMEADGAPAEDAIEILKASDRAARLVRQLLTFSRKEVPRPRLLDVNALVTDMCDLLKRSIGVHIELGLELSDRNCVVSIDPSHMEQILINVAINARDAMNDGGVLSIRTDLRTVEGNSQRGVVPPGQYVCLEVADTGCGMSSDVATKVFEPFFTTKERGQGTGLGLATVYGVVSGAGGFIDVASTPGEGTTFTILLPAADELADHVESSDPDSSEHSGSERTVLVVDDEPNIGELVRRILFRHGYSVANASSGMEALDLVLKGARFDLVLSDVAMPEMSGIELAHKMREVAPHQPFILMSGYADERITDPSIVEDVAGFIEKPFQEQALLAILDSALGWKEARASTAVSSETN